MKKSLCLLAMVTLVSGCNLFDGGSSKNKANDGDPNVVDFEKLTSDLFDVADPLASDPIDISQLEIKGLDIDASFFQGLHDQE